MKTILAAIDFSDVTEGLVHKAGELSRACGATLYLLHIEPPEPDFVGYGAGPQHVRDQVARDAAAAATTVMSGWASTHRTARSPS